MVWKASRKETEPGERSFTHLLKKKKKKKQTKTNQKHRNMVLHGSGVSLS